MADDGTNALDRIDRALARIEAAGASHIRSRQTLTQRHETLRGRIAEAIEALDTVITDRGQG